MTKKQVDYQAIFEAVFERKPRDKKELEAFIVEHSSQKPIYFSPHYRSFVDKFFGNIAK